MLRARPQERSSAWYAERLVPGGSGIYSDIDVNYGEDALTTAGVGPSLRALPLPEFTASFRSWLATHRADLDPLLAPGSDFDVRVDAARALRRLFWESDWGRVGWPEHVGGLGGTSLHRAIVTEELFRAGWTGPTIFEHLEIIAPTLVAHAAPDFAATVVPRFLDGSRAWAQGFSEPEAGSDLASLRTRAAVDGDELVINGAKIWTTWAKYADWCLALVRTGTTEERHRGLTMVALSLHSPGVVVRPILQANGIEELAEVSFTDVRVPVGQVVGTVGGGWRVAMYLLARERGTLTWLRHCGFRERLADSAPRMPVDADRQLGDVILQIAGVRAAAATLLVREAAGEDLGPLSAYNKLLGTRAEQAMYNLLRDMGGSTVAAPGDDPEEELLQQDYLFSRIVTVYGGSQQMQLMTVARHILGLGHG
jgi:alkylation response protein AidB-like acyl-CoA dehydrogenase